MEVALTSTSKLQKMLVLATGLVALVLMFDIAGDRQVSAAPKITEVRDADNPGRHPFQATAACTIDPGERFCFNNFAVPANQLLVIETLSVSGLGRSPAGSRAYQPSA